MVGKGLSIMVLMSFLSLLFCSCTDDGVTRPQDAWSLGDDDFGLLEDELREAPELGELIEIRDEIAARAIARNVTPDELRAAGNDACRANELLGLTPVEASARRDRINALVASLRGRYAALENIEARIEIKCAECDIDHIALSWEYYRRVLAAPIGGSAQPAPEAPERAPLKCRMSQLVIGFGLCAIKSGGNLLFYAICSYGVFCGSCDGGMADVICGG